MPYGTLEHYNHSISGTINDRNQSCETRNIKLYVSLNKISPLLQEMNKHLTKRKVALV